MKTHWIYGIALVASWCAVATPARADTEALYWHMGRQKDVTCVYGRITVLASIKNIYFCGAQWGGVGGYSGIQDLYSDRRTIFSIWDTSPQQHPHTSAAHAETVFNRFGGEGEGGHTHMLWDWKNGQTFQFFLRKQPGAKPDTTDTSFYGCDARHPWRHVATITSPNGAHARGAAFVELMSWIENIGGQADFAQPKLDLVSLWIGADPAHLKRLTRSGGSSGSGRWGILHGEYFLAEGSREQLAALFAKLEPKYGRPNFGVDGQELAPLADTPLAEETLRELSHLPQSPATKESRRGSTKTRKHKE
jgi:hypothetical protein